MGFVHTPQCVFLFGVSFLTQHAVVFWRCRWVWQRRHGAVLCVLPSRSHGVVLVPHAPCFSWQCSLDESFAGGNDSEVTREKVVVRTTIIRPLNALSAAFVFRGQTQCI